MSEEILREFHSDGADFSCNELVTSNFPTEKCRVISVLYLSPTLVTHGNAIWKPKGELEIETAKVDK